MTNLDLRFRTAFHLVLISSAIKDRQKKIPTPANGFSISSRDHENIFIQLVEN